LQLVQHLHGTRSIRPTTRPTQQRGRDVRLFWFLCGFWRERLSTHWVDIKTTQKPGLLFIYLLAVFSRARRDRKVEREGVKALHTLVESTRRTRRRKCTLPKRREDERFFGAIDRRWDERKASQPEKSTICDFWQVGSNTQNTFAVSSNTTSLVNQSISSFKSESSLSTFI